MLNHEEGVGLAFARAGRYSMGFAKMSFATGIGKLSQQIIVNAHYVSVL